MATRRQHYNPRYYLRGFTESRDSEYLWRYEKPGNDDPRRLTVGNVGVERDYYAYTRADGRIDIDSVETQLANHIEQPAKPIIEQLRNGNYSLSNEDKWVLATYLYVTLRRVPKNRQRVDNLMPKMIDKQLKRLHGRYRLIYDAHQSKIDELLDDWSKSTPDFLYMPGLDPTIQNVIASMNWHFVIPVNNLKFLTSDNPFVFDEREGIKPPNGQMLFPISQDLTLWGTWERGDRPVNFQADEGLTQEFNGWVVSQAVQYVYSCCRANWISELIDNFSQSEES